MDSQQTETLLTELTTLVRQQNEYFQRIIEANERTDQMNQKYYEQVALSATADRRYRTALIVTFVLMCVALVVV